MQLDNDKRRQFRIHMMGAFDANSLDLFLQDWLDRKLDHIIAAGKTFPMQCQLVITWAEEAGKLRVFLEAVVADPNLNQTIKAFSAALLATAAPVVAVAGTTPRLFMVNQRPLLDRNTFWARLDALANGTAGHRVLIVNGGVGKTYSRWPLSHICDPARGVARLACVDANAGRVIDVDGPRLASLIASRLWGDGSLGEADTLAQAHRVSKDLGGLIVQRLAALQERTWVIIDELNLVSLDESAIEVVRRLCHAVDGNECPNVWLFLFGLDPARLGPRVGPYVALDLVCRPTLQDIEDYLRWFAGEAGKQPPPYALEKAAGELDALLLPTPDHANWYLFHEQLGRHCKSIATGVTS